MALGALDKNVVDHWRSFAAFCGGRFDEDSKAVFHRPTPGIQVDAGAARIYLDIEQQGGNSTVKITRARAHLTVPRGPRFKVHHQGLASSIGKALGTQDVELGGPLDFDRVFVVKSKEPAIIRRMWTDRIKALLLEFDPPPHVTCDGSLVQFKINTVLTDRESLLRVLAVMGELVESDIFGLAALQQLPKVEYHPPSGPWNERTLPTAMISTIVPVEIGPVVGKKTAHTRATAREIAKDTQLEVQISGNGQLDIDEASLPETARSPARRVGSAVLTVGDGAAVVDWNGIEDDVDHLQAGIELVTAFAVAPKQGTFR